MAEQATDTVIDPKPAEGDKSDGDVPSAADVLLSEGDKPAEDSKPDEGDKGDKDKPADDKPAEDIKYDINLPKDSFVTQEHLEKIVSYAKEQGLSKEQAQDLLNRENTALSERKTETLESVRLLHDQWKKDARNDKEFGGANFTENLNLAKAGFDTFATTELGEILVQTGLGNHVEFLKLFQKLGELTKSDSFVIGSNNNKSEKSFADVLYGKKEKGD